MPVYQSPYSSIKVEPEKRFLSATWFKESINLNEGEVRNEISKILDYVKEFTIAHIVVDVRNYPFRDNENIQHWINHNYIPQIVELGVQRYAIIVEEMIKSKFENIVLPNDSEDEIVVQYFTDENKALAWIDSFNAT